MKRLLFFIALSLQAQVTINTLGWPFDFKGPGFTAPSGFISADQVAAGTLTVTLSQHGQGATPNAFCVNSSGEFVSPRIDNPGYLGDITFTFSPDFTGRCFINGPGSSSGSAGNVVGPTSATANNLPDFSGTSGKILKDSGIATSTVVKGAASLTTVGAVPYVSVSGVLNQDQTSGGQFFWDATNHRLGIGTVTPGQKLEIVGAAKISAGIDNGGGTIGLYTNGNNSIGYNFTGSNALDLGSFGNVTFRNYNGSSYAGVMTIFGTATAATGNVAIGVAPTNGNFRLDIQSSGSAGTSRVYDQTATTGSSLFVVRAGAGQSGNLQEWQNNAGTALASIGSQGLGTFVGLSINGDATLATANQLVWSAKSKIYSPTDGIITVWNNAQTDFDRLQFGGTTSSFPAWARSGASLLARLADNSAYTSIITGGLRSDGAGLSFDTSIPNAGEIASSYFTLGASNNGGLITTVTRTITGAVTDAYTAGVSLTPTYTAATAQTVTRHNYLNLANPVLTGAGPAALTDATVFRFDAAAGTHKAVDAGTTKITPGGVDAWVKVNVNGTIYYMPAYTSKTI